MVGSGLLPSRCRECCCRYYYTTIPTVADSDGSTVSLWFLLACRLRHSGFSLSIYGTKLKCNNKNNNYVSIGSVEQISLDGSFEGCRLFFLWLLDDGWDITTHWLGSLLLRKWWGSRVQIWPPPFVYHHGRYGFLSDLPLCACAGFDVAFSH